MAQIDAVLKMIKNSDEPFGGINCIFFGDFSQIKPVGDVSVATGNRELFKVVELTETMRQRDDPDSRNALDNLSEGSCTQQDIDLLLSRNDSVNDWSRDFGLDVTATFSLDSNTSYSFLCDWRMH